VTFYPLGLGSIVPTESTSDILTKHVYQHIAILKFNKAFGSFQTDLFNLCKAHETFTAYVVSKVLVRTPWGLW